MAESKKYFYMRVKENFFDSDEMILLESMPDGYLYSNILLKLYCRSLKNEGRLMLNEKIPFNTTMLANVTRHSVGVIEKAMRIFQDLGLIEILDNGAIYMLEIQQFIGQSSSEGDRIKAYRQKIESEKRPQLQESTNVVQNSYICTPYIELDTDLNINNNKRENRRKPALFPFFPYAKYPDIDPIVIQDLKSKFELLWGCWLNTRRGTQQDAKDSFERTANETGLSEFADRLEVAFGMYMRSEEWNNDIVKSLPKWIPEFINWEDEYNHQLKNNKTKPLEKGKTWERMSEHVESERK